MANHRLRLPPGVIQRAGSQFARTRRRGPRCAAGKCCPRCPLSVLSRGKFAASARSRSCFCGPHSTICARHYRSVGTFRTCRRTFSAARGSATAIFPSIELQASATCLFGRAAAAISSCNRPLTTNVYAAVGHSRVDLVENWRRALSDVLRQ